MISEKIKNSAEKAMPKEKRFIDRIRSFFGKKSRLLTVSGIAAVVLLYPIYLLLSRNVNDRYNVLIAALDFVELTAAGVFFANIETFSLKKYARAVSIWMAVLYLSTVTVFLFTGLDTSTWTEVIPYWILYIAAGLPFCATLIALSVILAYLVTCSMKEE